MVKKQPQIEDFILAANDGGADPVELGDLNPVVQTRFALEREAHRNRQQGQARGKAAYGALRKLGLNFVTRREARGQHALQAVDVGLSREVKASKERANAKQAEERMVAEAEAAALEAKRRNWW